MGRIIWACVVCAVDEPEVKKSQGEKHAVEFGI